MKADGPPGASSNGFNENLALFQQGKCGMWIDATVAASFVTDPEGLDGRRQGRLRARARTTASASAATGCGHGRWPFPPARRRPTRPRSSSPGRPARTISTSSPRKEGWANVPPGTRTSLYDNPEYQKAAPFAKMTLDSINAADPTNPTVKPVPYIGVQFVAIPEFQGLGTTVGQLFSAALAGQMSASTTRSSRPRTPPPAR